MASITKNQIVELDPHATLAAVRDFASPHILFPGVLAGSEMDGEDERIVTFAGGMVVRERLVDLDDTHRRIAYTVVDGPFAHHHASMSVHDAEGGLAQFEWTSDVLPHELAPVVSDLMDQGLAALAVALGNRAA